MINFQKAIDLNFKTLQTKKKRKKIELDHVLMF
jgi:hypothetical protein